MALFTISLNNPEVRDICTNRWSETKVGWLLQLMLATIFFKLTSGKGPSKESGDYHKVNLHSHCPNHGRAKTKKVWTATSIAHVGLLSNSIVKNAKWERCQLVRSFK